jgi:hypothetical protein
MEYEYAFGKVESIGNYGNPAIATIQVIGGYNFKTKTVIRFNGSVKSHFPNRGRVFAPNFANDFPAIQPLNYIVFNYCENKKLTADDWTNPYKDLYLLPAKHDGGIVTLVPCYPILNDISDEDLRNPQTGKYKTAFFFIRIKDNVEYICGCMNSDMTPKKGKEIKAWKKEAGDIIITEEGERLLVVNIEKRQPDFWIDCMTDRQLAEWFKKLSLPKGTLSQDLQETVKNAILSLNIDQSLNEKRWERIQRHLNIISFDWNELQKLRDNPVFQETIRVSVDRSIDAILEANKAEIERRKAALEQEYVLKEKELYSDLLQKKDSLKKDIDKLDEEYIKTKKKTDELGVERNNIEKEIESAKSELLTISDKKNDVINDIKIKAGLGLFNVEKQESGYSFCYPLEHFNQDQKSIEIGSITDMENPVAHLLQNRVLIVDDIGDGVIFALQLGNVIYQLCQPSPKWISFHDFWTESLRPIWESAHQNPNIWHVLLIENFNIALPECWGKPLWNILSGMTTLLPCAKHPTLPDNLRIIVSEAATESDDNSHLGLPTKVGKKWTRIKNGHVE